MRDVGSRIADKKAELEGYAPNMAIAEVDVTGGASVTGGFVPVLVDGPVDFLTNTADPARQTHAHERNKVS
jgi:hypothetical protein